MERFKSVGVGNGYTCVIDIDGVLDCWGSSLHGLDTPPEGKYVQVSTGDSWICVVRVEGNTTSTSCGLGPHACALDSEGGVTCWGDLSFGQGEVPAGEYTSVSTGGAHSCGLRTDSTIACWGYDTQGQANAPSGTFIAVSAGGAHNCGIKENGSILCWGGATSGTSSTVSCRVDSQGNADCISEAGTTSEEVPSHLEAPEGAFKAVASGSTHNCAIRTDDSLHCWGELPAELQIDPDGRFESVYVGGANTCALADDGAAHCWGRSAHISEFQFGNHHSDQRFKSISAGVEHGCGITTEGALYCSGNNQFGQVAPFVGQHKAVSVESPITCSIQKDGAAGCWHNLSRQLTTATDQYSLKGQLLTGGYWGRIRTPEGVFSKISVISAATQACGLKEDSSIHCWGYDGRFPAMTLGNGYSAISTANRLCGAGTEGGVVCWEWDYASNSFNAEDVSDMTGIYTAIASGPNHVCAIREDGTVQCSGSNDGCLGPGRTTPPEGRFISLSAAKDHTCGVREDGELECWGAYPFFNNVPKSGNFVQVVSTGTKACALSRDGSVECWGSTASPVGNSFETISLANDVACGVLRDGRISCWRP